MNITCSAPEISSYNFMKYLFASLAKKRNVIIDLDQIVDKIYAFKQVLNISYSYLFEDIEFRASVDSVVSYDINEGINNLQTFGIIGKLNPTYEKIVIYLTEKDADEILSLCSEPIREQMSKLASSFSE